MWYRTYKGLTRSRLSYTHGCSVSWYRTYKGLTLDFFVLYVEDAGIWAAFGGTVPIRD